MCIYIPSQLSPTLAVAAGMPLGMENLPTTPCLHGMSWPCVGVMLPTTYSNTGHFTKVV